MPSPSVASESAGATRRRIAYLSAEIATDDPPSRLSAEAHAAEEVTDAEWDEASPEDVAEEPARPGTDSDAPAQNALEPTTEAPPPADETPFTSERPGLLREMRRTWMGPAFKRSPHVVLLVSVRLARVPGADTPAAAGLVSRTSRALALALGDLGRVHALAPFAHGLLLPGTTVRQAEKIADAIGAAVDARSIAHPQSPMIFAAGIAALHRDDDPTVALCLAENCLRAAEKAVASRVVTETDPTVRTASRATSNAPS